MSRSRLDYELDHEVGLGALAAHGGVPALIEHFRSSGGAATVDGSVPYKRRKRGLSAWEMCESLLVLPQGAFLVMTTGRGTQPAGGGITLPPASCLNRFRSPE